MSRGNGEFDLIGGSVNITNSINPLPVVNATASNEAVALGQLTNGSLAPTFGATVVSNATASNQAVNFSQTVGLGQSIASFAGAINTVYTNSGTKPIIVYGATTYTSGHTCVGSINGNQVQFSSTSSNAAGVTLFVLPGETWEITDSVSSATLYGIYIQQ
jgi:hypothetical protein